MKSVINYGTIFITLFLFFFLIFHFYIKMNVLFDYSYSLLLFKIIFFCLFSYLFIRYFKILNKKKGLRLLVLFGIIILLIFSIDYIDLAFKTSYFKENAKKFRYIEALTKEKDIKFAIYSTALQKYELYNCCEFENYQNIYYNSEFNKATTDLHFSELISAHNIKYYIFYRTDATINAYGFAYTEVPKFEKQKPTQIYTRGGLNQWVNLEPNWYYFSMAD